MDANEAYPRSSPAREMTGGEVKLLGVWSSAYVIRAMIALNAKGVKYEFLEEPFWSKSELLLESNPVYKKMPVLIHDGRPICESMIIVEYVDDVWNGPPGFLPSDPHARATARFWAVYIDDKLIPTIRAIRSAEFEAEKAALVSQAQEGLQLLEEAFEKCSDGKGYFGGDAIGYVDIALGCYLGWLKATEKFSDVELLTEAKMPLLKAWAERFLADAAAKEAIAETDKFIEMAKVIHDRMKAGLFPRKV